MTISSNDPTRRDGVSGKGFTRMQLLHEMILATRFGMVGIVATAVHILVVWLLLTSTTLSPIIANTLAFLTAFGISFAGNYHWTFGSPGNLSQAMRRYLLISVSAFLINTLILTILVSGEWYPPNVSAIFSATVVPVITFLASRFWGFNTLSPTPGASKDKSLSWASLNLIFNKHLKYGLLVGCLALVQGSPFMTGYRLTADDVAFHQFVIDGWSASWGFVKGVAISSGRIVHFIDIPFSLLGSYYADYWSFRFFYTTLYFLNFLLIAVYASMLSGVRVAFFVLLTLISLHPLDYFHLAPTAYPFHVSIPVFLITISRIGLWHLRKERVRYFKGIEFALLSLCFMGMMFSEYGFLFAVSLMFAEIAARTLQSDSSDLKFYQLLFRCLRRSNTLKDIFLVFVFMVLYFGFRYFFPSTYDGNRISDNFEIDLIIKTLTGHIYGGTAIASIYRYASSIVFYLRDLGPKYLLLVYFVFCGTFAVAINLLHHLRFSNNPTWLGRRFVSMAAVGIICASIVTLPVAMTGKYQSWCVNLSSCIFLDSRISYLGVGVFLAGLMGLAVIRFGTSRLKLNITIVFVSATLAGVAATTYINNLRIEADMKKFVSGWDRAKFLACFSEDKILWDILPSIIEPVRRISFHPGFDIDRYWSSYLRDQRQRVNCDNPYHNFKELFPEISFGERILANQSRADFNILGSGWSRPEDWGTWSDGADAIILLPLGTGQVSKILVEANPLLSPSHPKQTLEVKINGIPTKSVTLTAYSGGIFEIEIPEEIRQQLRRSGRLLKLQLHFPDAARPVDLGINSDGRMLAIGLIALTVQ